MWLAGAGVLGLAAVALTFDRGAWLGLCAAAVAVAAFAGPRARRGLALVALLVMAVAVFDPAIRLRFTSVFSSGANADRVFIWTRAVEIIRREFPTPEW